MEAACRWAGKRPEKERYAAPTIANAHQALATFRSAINSATGSSASWINQVERWFGLLTDRALRRGVHRSVADLEHDIRVFIAATNADPRPFRWVKTADDILASVKRFCLQTLGISTVEEALARTSESVA